MSILASWFFHNSIRFKRLNKGLGAVVRQSPIIFLHKNEEGYPKESKEELLGIAFLLSICELSGTDVLVVLQVIEDVIDFFADFGDLDLAVLDE